VATRWRSFAVPIRLGIAGTASGIMMLGLHGIQRFQPWVLSCERLRPAYLSQILDLFAEGAIQLFTCQRAITPQRRQLPTDPARELAASVSQEPYGSHAPSIRVGVNHQAPETPFGKPGSES
jgi:hypothetical protein